MAGRIERQQLTSCQQVLEADIKCGVCVGCEDCPLLAGDVLWPAVLVSHRITDLCIGDSSCQHQLRIRQDSVSEQDRDASGG